MRRFALMQVSAYTLLSLLAGSGCATERVTDADIDSIIRVISVAVSPKSTTLQVGDGVQLAATVVMSDNSVAPPAEWTSANPSVAIVSSTGMVTAVAEGSSRIRASSGSQSDSALIAVSPVTIPVATVEVTPPSANIYVGKTVQLTAVAKDANGNPLTGRTMAWSSSNVSIARVTAAGLVTGVAAGNADIVAMSGGKSDTSAITVERVPVASVTVAPSSATIAVGQTVQLQATVRDADGNVLSGRAVTWSSSSSSVATVSSSGLVTAVAEGSATVTATSEGSSGSSSVTVTVAPVPVASVTVEPSSASIEEKKTVQLTATPRDAAGNALSGRTVTWASSNTAVATVSSSGLVTGVKAGSATITATSEGKNGTSSITVTQVPVASVTVAPSTANVEVGRTVQLTATVRDANGNILTNRVVTWASSDRAIATVSTSGLVTGVAPGSATVTATSEGKNGSSAITVVSAPPPPPPPPPGTSCLDRSGPTTTLSGVKTSPYSNTNLADNTKIDASTAQFLTSANIPVTIGGGSNICYHRGETIGQFPPSTAWSPMHDTYAFKVEGIPSFMLENIREFDYGDGITIHENSSANWTIRGVYFKYMRDDCVQNDWMNSGTIEDSFFDGCFQGLSSRSFTGSQQDGSSNLIVVKNSLYRLQDMDKGYSNPGHGGFFKWDAKGPMVSLYNNVYRVDSPSQHSNHSFGPPDGKLKDCANNVMIWLGSGPFPEKLPSCYTLLTGAEGLQYWNNAAAKWKADHPTTLPDVGAPIVSMYSPSGSATLTGTVKLTATAVDDRDVAGVQFKLNGQNIGSEVTTESPLTKFTLSWDSRSMANGTYTLTATARDNSGNIKVSSGITVTISN